MSWYYIQGVLTLGGIYMVAVLGLSLITGFTGLFSFGHAGFMAIGAYSTAVLTSRLGVPFPAALIASGLFASVIAFLLGRVTLNLKGDYFCIATLGFGEAIRLILDNVQYFGGARGWSGIPRRSGALFMIGGESFETLFIEVVIVAAIAAIAMRCIVVSRQGRNMVAVREEELAAQMIGIDTFRTKVMSLMISAFYVGVAGGLYAVYLGFLQPRMFNMQRSVELTIMVIFGGLGSIGGGMIGAFILTSLPEVLRDLAEWRFVIYGAVVVFIIIARPEGLMGGREFFGKKGIFKNVRIGDIFRRGEKRGFKSN